MQQTQKHRGACLRAAVQELHQLNPFYRVFKYRHQRVVHFSFLFQSPSLLDWGDLPSLSFFSLLCLCSSHFMHFVSTASYLTRFFPLLYPILSTSKYILFLRLFSSFSFVCPFFFENLFSLIFLSAS